MERLTQVCVSIVTVAAIAAIALVLMATAQCQRDTNVKRAELGYSEYGPGTIIAGDKK